MKIHSRKTDGKRQRQTLKKKTNGRPAAAFFAALLFIAFVGFVISTRQVEYKSRSEQLSVQISKAERELAQLESEISYLKIEMEPLTTRKHIFAKVAEFKLGLKASSPRQVSTLHTNRNNTQYARSNSVPGRSVAYLHHR